MRYLIDSRNNNKVIRTFNTKKEAMSYVDNMELTENWENSYDEFEDFKDQFFTITSKEMNEAVKQYGERKLNYWT